MGRTAAALVLFLQAFSNGGDKLPVPSEEDQARALKLIQTLFEPDYAKRSTDARRELARKLLAHSPKTAQDPSAHFVILSEASKLAAGAGDPKTSLDALAEIEKVFDVDGVKLRTEALDDARTSTRTADGARLVAEAYLKLVDDALEADDYDAAGTAASKGASAARKARDSLLAVEFRNRTKEISSLKREFNKIKSDVARLKENPDDPAGNLALGTFHGLSRGDWDRALPHLAKGSDAALKKAAQDDLAAPTDETIQVAVGDGWWALAEKERDKTGKANLAARAHHWYTTALPKLGSLARLKLEPRLAEAAKLAATISRKGAPVDLLTWVDPNRHGVPDGGRWTRDGKTLVSASDGNIRYAKIIVPCQPPDEYDLTIAVRKRDSDGTSFWIGLVAQGRQFAAILDWDGDESTFGNFDGESGEDLQDLYSSERLFHQDPVISASKPTTVTVSVRRTRLTVKVGQAVILDWKNPPYARAAVSDRIQIPNPRALFLAARDNTIYEITELKLTPVSGTPRRLP